MVEQNANIGLRYTTYGYVYESGRIVHDGTAEALRHNADVEEVYCCLGSDRRRSFRDIKHRCRHYDQFA